MYEEYGLEALALIFYLQSIKNLEDGYYKCFCIIKQIPRAMPQPLNRTDRWTCVKRNILCFKGKELEDDKDKVFSDELK